MILRILNLITVYLFMFVTAFGAVYDQILHIDKQPGSFDYFHITYVLRGPGTSHNYDTVETNVLWGSYNIIVAIYQRPSGPFTYWHLHPNTNTAIATSTPTAVYTYNIKDSTATDGAYVDKVATAWPGGTNRKYAVYRESKSIPGSFMLIGTVVNDTTFTDNNIIQNEIYRYWVRYVGSDPDTGYAALAAPVISVSKGTYPDKIEVSWTSIYGAEKYKIWRGPSNEFELASPITDVIYNVYNDTAPTSATNYYWVMSENYIYTSSISSNDFGWLGDLPIPTNVTASDGLYADKVQITWSNIPGLNYNVYRNLSNYWDSATNIGTAYTNFYNDGTTEVGVSNDYWVVAFNSQQTGAPSISDSGWKKGITKITNVVASDGTYADSIRVTWGDPGGVTNYIILRNTEDTTNTASIVGNSITTNYIDNAVSLLISNYYWVIGENGYSTSAVSDSDLGWVGILGVSDVAASDGTDYTKVNISWGYIADASGYNIYRGDTVYPVSLTMLTNTEDTYTTDVTATPGTVYYYYLAAMNSIQTSVYSRANAGNIGLLVSPSLLATRGTSYTNVIVSWNSVAGATGYNLWTNTVSDTNTAGIAANLINTTYTANLALGVTNYYWVKATNSLQVTPFSNVATGWVGALTVPGINASDGDSAYNGIYVNWDTVTGATRYQLCRSLTNDINTASNINNTVYNYYLDTTALPDIYYYYWVKASNSFQSTAFSTSDVGWANGMIMIPAGSFVMGNVWTNYGAEGNVNEIPLHTVPLSTYYIAKCEVSKLLWDNVYTWATNNGYSFAHAGAGKSPEHPVHTINLYDIVKWCNARSEMEGLTPCYYTNTAQTFVYRTGTFNPESNHVNWVTSGYRLPTEAEWEKAARGGVAGTRFAWSFTNTITHSRANYYSTNAAYSAQYDVSPTRGYHPTYNDAVLPYTCPVLTFAPNNYGIYNTIGNVGERCWDFYSGSWYSNPSATLLDTKGPPAATYRIVRGGAWNDLGGFYNRISYRGAIYPTDATYGYGFRCVRSIK